MRRRRAPAAFDLHRDQAANFFAPPMLKNYSPRSVTFSKSVPSPFCQKKSRTLGEQILPGTDAFFRAD